MSPAAAAAGLTMARAGVEGLIAFSAATAASAFSWVREPMTML